MPRHASLLDNLLLEEDFEGDCYPNESLAKHTSYQIGGPARYLVTVQSVSALSRLIKACETEAIPWFILGRGTNVLAADTGFSGVVIVLGRDFKVCRYDEDSHMLCCGAGVALATVVQEAFRRSLSGLEFAVGTPGSIGGALRMNAGSKDTWIGAIVSGVTTFSSAEGLRTRAGSSIEWNYRQTSFRPDEVILECQLSLKPADPFFVRDTMESLLAKRRKSQPLTLPSCGSVFRNPQSLSAGALIDAAGLKGYAIGGAMVSPVHANFIVNTGNASAADVLAVIDEVKKRVLRQNDVELQPEVVLLGF